MGEIIAQPRVVFEDPDLPHQIVIRLTGGNSHRIMVSCNCMRLPACWRTAAYEPLEVRTRWEGAEAIAAWRKHLGQAGEPPA